MMMSNNQAKCYLKYSIMGQWHGIDATRKVRVQWSGMLWTVVLVELLLACFDRKWSIGIKGRGRIVNFWERILLIGWILDADRSLEGE